MAQDRQSTAERRRNQFRNRRQEILLNLRHELTELSQQCHQKNMPEAAQDVTAISLELTAPTTGQAIPSLAQLPISSKLSTDEQLWRTRLRSIRSDKAKELYSLGRSSLRADLPSLAYQLIQDVLRLDPDHKHARSVLGQQLFSDRSRENDATYAGEWVSPFEARTRSGSNPETNHPEFGWIPISHVTRYEEGHRPWKGKWISIEKEAELRRDFTNAWEIRTEHFLVKTNTSREEGVVLSRKLEIYYDWLRTNFAAFFDTPKTLAQRFEQAQAGRRGRAQSQPMDVHYYATRAEYDRRLRGRIPPNLVTNGLYWEDDRTCYLFRNEENGELDTAFHEATHQILDLATLEHRLAAARKKRILLRQTTLSPWVLCENSNFWILEGLACYMESFRITDGMTSAGDPGHIRFLGARQRLLNDRFFIDTRTFSSLGKDTFRQHPNHTQLYTQGSGFAHFLLHYKDGLYRDALIGLLSAVYRPDLQQVTKEPSLETLTGVPFDVLDLQYRDHMENLAMQLQQLPAGP